MFYRACLCAAFVLQVCGICVTRGLLKVVQQGGDGDEWMSAEQLKIIQQ